MVVTSIRAMKIGRRKKIRNRCIALNGALPLLGGRVRILHDEWRLRSTNPRRGQGGLLFSTLCTGATITSPSGNKCSKLCVSAATRGSLRSRPSSLRFGRPDPKFRMPSSRFSEWNIVRLSVQIRIFGGRSLRRRSRGPSLTARGTPAAAFALASATEHLHVFGHYAQARTLLAGLFVVPGIQLKPAFDEDFAPFLEVLLRYLGLPPPKRHVHERYLFLLFAIFP